jgi:WD40 repeat protein
VEISPKSSKEFFANFCAEINNQKDEICSNDNPVIVTINDSGNVKLWTIDNNKGKLFEPVHITEDGIGAKFTPDGKSLAIISKNDKPISFKQQKETQLKKIEKSFQVPIEPDIIDFLEKKNSKDFMMLASYRNKGTELIEINDQTPSEAKIDPLKTSLGQVQKQLELVETSLVSINSGL